MRLFFLIFITLITAPLRAEADEPLHANWEKQGQYREDVGGKLTLDDILSHGPATWTPVPASGLNLGFKKEPHWLRVPLPPCGEAGGAEQVFEIGYPILDRLDVWFMGPKGRAPVVTTGDMFPYSQRPIEHVTFGFPYTCGAHQEVVIRIATTSSLQVPMAIWERPAYDRYLLNIERPQLLYFGAVLIMALYNFFIYLIVRRPPYLYYVLFVLSFASFQLGISGLGFRYLWPELPLINVHIIDKSINCIGMFAFAFTLAFLNAKVLTPRLYRFSLWLLSALFLYSLASFAVPGGVAVRISIGFVTTAIITVLFITAHSIRKRQREGYFYGLAWTTFLFGTIALAMNKLGILPRTTFTEHSQQISTVLEMLLLSFALADQMNILRFNLAKSHQQLEKTLESIEEIVDQKTQSIRSIMDTLKVGIITIATQDFIIQSEYSHHTEVWLGERELGGRRFDEVFLNRLVLGEDARSLIMSALQAIMDESSENFQFNGFHLPQEAQLVTTLGPKAIVIDWTPILNNEGRVVRLLIAFHDVTELRSLKQEQAAQTRILIRLNQLLSADDMALRAFLIRGRRLLDSMHDQISDEHSAAELLPRLFINFHTLKGESRTLGLSELSDLLHRMEDRLTQVRKQPSLWRPAEILADIAGLEALISEYASLYESHFGSLTEERLISIKQGKMESWELALQKLKPHSPEEKEAHRLLLNDIFKVLHMDLTTYEEKLQTQAARIARELGKPDPQVLLAGQGVFLSQRMMEQLDQVFIHILQNALVHGIESGGERKAAGKGAAGLIYIKLARQGDEVVITARDDGRGVNLKEIRQRAIKLGIMRANEDLTEARLEACLLHAGFSSREHVTNHAGRGVGMGAVRQFVEELSGRMHLEFVPERDGHRTFALVMTFPARLFPTLSLDHNQAA